MKIAGRVIWGNRSYMIRDGGLVVLSERLKRMNGLERFTFEFDS